jgi:ferredoxin
MVECKEGDSIFEIAQRAGIPIPTACVGKATCGLCRVKVIEGERHLSPLNHAEQKHLGNTYFITRLRLSCQARLTSWGTSAPNTQATAHATTQTTIEITVQLPDLPPRKISTP